MVCHKGNHFQFEIYKPQTPIEKPHFIFKDHDVSDDNSENDFYTETFDRYSLLPIKGE
jgi:hypothetical protein